MAGGGAEHGVAVAASPRPARITVEALDKSFKTANADVVAVDNVSFEVKSGRIRCSARPVGLRQEYDPQHGRGLPPKTNGRIRIDTDDVVTGEVNRKVGYVFQRDTVFPGARWKPTSATASKLPGG
jgi:NitT/TauT family transport system ATP-binding protein